MKILYILSCALVALIACPCHKMWASDHKRDHKKVDAYAELLIDNQTAEVCSDVDIKQGGASLQKEKTTDTSFKVHYQAQMPIQFVCKGLTSWLTSMFETVSDPFMVNHEHIKLYMSEDESNKLFVYNAKQRSSGPIAVLNMK